MIDYDRNKMIEKSARLALNPALRMRKDIDRIYIFPVNPFTYQQKNKRIYLKPAEAIILALFNGKKAFQNVIDDIANILKIKMDTAERIVGNYSRRYLRS
jgi:hypothetical protein